ncbi:MAG TPA: hypothetical protein VK772_07660 [Puia sp.]|jgi:hypothetical protein|nr:hypothetical protein [Puia sp.]
MKRRTFMLLIMAIQFASTGCIKTATSPGSASLTIVNAVNLSNPLVTNFTPVNEKNGSRIPLEYYSIANQIGYASSYEWGSYINYTSISLSQIEDTFANIWSGTLVLPVGSIHTLFLAGDTTKVDSLFSTDVIPYIAPGDSSTGVRFVNLAQNASSVLVTIQADTTHSPIANNISYKTITPFQQLPADVNALTNGYTFEFRDEATDSILTTVSLYNYSYPAQLLPFKCETVILIGQAGTSVQVPLSGMIYPNY